MDETHLLVSVAPGVPEIQPRKTTSGLLGHPVDIDIDIDKDSDTYEKGRFRFIFANATCQSNPYQYIYLPTSSIGFLPLGRQERNPDTPV
jgi:hypothetical protein